MELWLGGWPLVAGELFIKATVVLLAAGLGALLLKHASAASRHVVWSLAFVTLLALPVVAWLGPEWSASRLIPSAAPVSTPVVVEPMVRSTPGEETVRVERPATGPVPESVARPPQGADQTRPSAAVLLRTALRFAVVVWLVGAVLFLGRMVLDRIRVALVVLYTGRQPDERLRAHAERIRLDLGVRRRARVMMSDWMQVPVHWGVWRPTLVFPSDAADWSDERLRMTLIHELAHARRRDYVTHLLAELATALYWTNPLVWTARKSARAEQERACDDAVVRAGVNAHDYASHLVTVARGLGRRHAPFLALPLTRGRLGDRVERLLTATLDRSPLQRRVLWRVTVSAILISLPVMTASVGHAGNDLALAGIEGALSAGALTELWQLPGESGAESLPVLLARLENPSAEVRGVAALALGDLGRREAIDALLRHLTDSDAFVRENAVAALSKFDRPDVGPAIARMGRDSEASVRSVVTWALGEMVSRGQLDEAPAALALGYLAFEDPDEHTRGMALGALGELGAAGVDQLIRGLAFEDADLRTQVVFALGRSKDPRALTELSAIVTKEPSAQVRHAAVRALGMQDRPERLAPLQAALRDSDRHVRSAAVRALVSFDDAGAISAVLEMLRDPEHTVRLTAVWALEDMRNR